MEVKNITIEALGLTWSIQVHIVRCNDSSDPQISEHSHVHIWELIDVFYNNGWLSFPPDTVEFLLSEHCEELNEIVKIEGLS
jgi:hypothetical protein